MTMHIDAGGGGNAAGGDEKRHITLNGDQLILENQGSPDNSGVTKLTWKRSN
jgi:hypothetical protein